MVEAYFDDDGNVVVKGKLKGLYKTKEIEMLVDSGFSADLTLPLNIACEIGLNSQGVANVRLADGSITNVSLFTGMIDLDGAPRNCTIFVLPNVRESLIGMGLLQFYEVCFYGIKNKVTMKHLEENHVSELQQALRGIIPR